MGIFPSSMQKIAHLHIPRTQGENQSRDDEDIQGEKEEEHGGPVWITSP